MVISRNLSIDKTDYGFYASSREEFGIAIPSVEKVQSKEKHKIKWSLKLWLFSLIVNCEKKEIKQWTSNYSSKLIQELLQESVTELSFEIPVKENCVDLVGKLLELDDADKHWVNHFKERINVVKICESEMSKDMVLAISKKSEKFYIIPRNGSSKEQTSMYGAFIYFLREKGQEGVINSLLDGRAEEINELMRDADFKELLNSFDPSSWKLSTLLEDIKSMLDDHSSSISMLFLSFYTH